MMMMMTGDLMITMTSDRLPRQATSLHFVALRKRKRMRINEDEDALEDVLRGEIR